MNTPIKVDEATLSAVALDLRQELIRQCSAALATYAGADDVSFAQMADYVWQAQLQLLSELAELMAGRSQMLPKPNMQSAEDRGVYLVKAERLMRQAFGLPEAAPYACACPDCAAGMSLSDMIDYGQCTACRGTAV